MDGMVIFRSILQLNLDILCIEAFVNGMVIFKILRIVSCLRA